MSSLSSGGAGPSRPYKSIRFENVAASIDEVIKAEKLKTQPIRPGQRPEARSSVVTLEEARRSLHEDMQNLKASPHPHRAIRPRMPTTSAIHDFMDEVENIIKNKTPASECDYLDDMYDAAMKDIKCWDKHGYYTTIYGKGRSKEDGEDKEEMKEQKQADGEVAPGIDDVQSLADAVSSIKAPSNHNLAEERKKHLGIRSKGHYKHLNVEELIGGDSEEDEDSEEGEEDEDVEESDVEEDGDGDIQMAG
ncbi:uncharacterized protein FMAN_00262 [Fusarium mangiferae]|uniref:Uncharacterized protein n=1 Tax=Fusarium mangiferae TaxID=192010 RepID=A0A1L7TW38_FUSMA|nr:uncharacterized protein FMAN_00262 [Fusarium mangiferae]CVL02800.1 uncharacterized protein FMAN_00262 [Fusarium mangiferae]